MTDSKNPYPRKQLKQPIPGRRQGRTRAMITREPVSTIVGLLLICVLLARVPIIGAFSAGLLIGSGRPLANDGYQRTSRGPVAMFAALLSISSVVLGYPEVIPTWLKETALSDEWLGSGWIFGFQPDKEAIALGARGDISMQWLTRWRVAVCLGVVGVLVFVLGAAGSPRPQPIDQPRRQRRGAMRAYTPWIALEVIAAAFYVGLMPEILPYLDRYLPLARGWTGMSIILVPATLLASAAAGAGFLVEMRARTEEISKLAMELPEAGDDLETNRNRGFDI